MGECEQFGPVKMCHIEQGGYEKRKSRDIANAKVFIEFSEIADAIKCRESMDGRLYNGQPIRCSFVNEDMFRAKKFGTSVVQY